MLARLFLILLLTPASLLAQQAAAAPKDNSAAAIEELESIINEAVKLDDKNASVTIRSRTALLISLSDPARSEDLFLALWRFAKEQTDEAFDKEQAKLQILKYLMPRNPKLARRLLSEELKHEEPLSSSRTSRPNPSSRFTAKLAAQLIDSDPSAAAALLEKSLLVAITPTSAGALYRLRETNPVLADYVATKALEGIVNQPTLMALAGLHIFTGYVFPNSNVPLSTEAALSLQAVQFRYFLAGYEVLTASLIETNEALVKTYQYTQSDLQFRALNQGQMAAILAALAPRLHPPLAAELAAVSSRLSSQVPTSISQMTQTAVARLSGNPIPSEDPERRLIDALSNGDFDEGRKQLDRMKDSDRKKLYAQLVLRNEAKAFLAKTDVMGALTAIRKLEDPAARLVAYLDAIKVTKKKRDQDLTKVVVNEARLLIPQVGKNGLHVRALLSFAAVVPSSDTADDAFELLGSAVTGINALSAKSNEQKEKQTWADATMAELNDPASLLDAAEMEQAFSSVGLVDLDRTLVEAKKIEIKSVQLIARLVTIQGIIKRASNRKMPPRPAKASSNPKE